MRIHRLAQLFELKYGLKSLAISRGDKLNEVKKNLINTYNLYVNSDKAKEPVLQMLANVGEPFSKQLIEFFEALISNLDTVSAPLFFQQVNQILGAIRDMKGDSSKSVRNFIHDAVTVTKESDRNYREHLKSKFEMVISKLSSSLVGLAKSLQTVIRLEGPLEGGIVSPQRKELGKYKLLMFMKTPAAQAYGLDSLETMTRVLSYPDLKEKITTIINAIDRGHTPIDGPEVKAATDEIMKIYQERQQTNLSALEQTPEKAPPPVSLLGEKTPEE